MTLVLVLVAVVVLLLGQAAYYAVLWRGHRHREALRRRLQTLTTAPSTGLARERRLSHSPRLARFLEGLGFPVRIEQYLLETDLDTTVAAILAASVAMAAGLTLALGLISGNPILSAVLGIPAGLLAPIAWVLVVRSRRSRRLSMQLPEALDMIGRSLRAGHGVASGLQLVATEMSPPIAVEFGRCFEELRLGGNFRDAVRAMPHRAPDNFDLRLFATSLVIQHETGGNLVEVLDNIARTVRERLQFHGKLRALTTETRLSGYVLGALPFVCGIAIAMLNPSYLQPLHADPLGRAIVALGLGLWAVGALWMRRLSQVDY